MPAVVSRTTEISPASPASAASGARTGSAAPQLYDFRNANLRPPVMFVDPVFCSQLRNRATLTPIDVADDDTRTTGECISPAMVRTVPAGPGIHLGASSSRGDAADGPESSRALPGSYAYDQSKNLPTPPHRRKVGRPGTHAPPPEFRGGMG